MAEAPAYLSVARGRAWWKLLVELLLALLWWLVGAGVIVAVVMGAVGIKDLDELDILSKLVLIHLTLAAMIPAALASARVLGRNPWQLFSISGRLRSGWLGRCLGLALATQLAFVLFAVMLELFATGSITSFRHFDARVLYAVIITIVLVPFQASAEEVFNRGTLQQVIGGWGAPAWATMGLSTLAFAAMHGTPNLGTIAIVAMGFSFAWLTLETGGLEAAMAGHIINNVIAFVLAAISHGADSLDPQELNASVGVVSLIIQLVSIAIYTTLVIRAWRRSASQGSATR